VSAPTTFVSIVFETVSAGGGITAAPAKFPTAGAETSALRVADNPQDGQKRVSTARAVPQNWQALMYPSPGLNLVAQRRELCWRGAKLANQLKANSALTVKPLFSGALRALINSFASVFVLNSTLKTSPGV